MLQKKKAKFGCYAGRSRRTGIDEIAKLPHIQVNGTYDNCSICRKSGRKSYLFSVNYVNYLLTLSAKKVDNVNMSILSMGMTNDYQVAIEEGATMVRVGTGIFGAQQLRSSINAKIGELYKMGVLDKFLDIMKLSDDDDYDDDDFFDDDV